MCFRQALAIVAACAAVAPAHAEVVDATLTTLMVGRQDPRDDQVHTVVPVYELVSIRAAEIGNPWFDKLDVVVGAWGRVDAGEPMDDRTVTGDVDVAFIQGRLLDERVGLRLGRQLVIGGVARNLQMDGLNLDSRLWRKLGLSLYGGVPVTRHFELDRGDAVGGARLFWRQSNDTELGVSIIHVRDDGELGRQDAGVDGRLRPWTPLTLTGTAVLSTTEGRLAEFSAAAEYAVLKNLSVRGDYRRTAPDLFLPRYSILAVFAENERDEAGGTVFYRPFPRVRALGSYHIVYANAEVGTRARGRVSVYLDDAYDVRLATDLQYRDAVDNGYIRGRLSGLYRASKEFRLTADVDVYRLDQPINGATSSLTVLGAASYDLSAKWHATVVGVMGSSPFLEDRFEVMAKVVYGAEYRTREVIP